MKLNLWTDGLDGQQVGLTDFWQYGYGRTCEDGDLAVYRRRASDVGTYGGWRWECRDVEAFRRLVTPTLKTEDRNQ